MNAVSWTVTVTLLVFGLAGLCMARKIHNGDSFYVMDEKAPTLFLVCGICMSYISAVTMSTGPGVCYENGPFVLLTTAQPGAWLGMLVAILFIGRKMKAVGCYTMPDYFAKRFADSNVTCLALVIMVTVMELYGISQLVSICTTLSEAMGLPYPLVIVLFILAIMLFCVPGGTWGIMMTDTLMFIVVLFTALVVCPVIIYSVCPEAIQALPESFWSVRGVNQGSVANGISNMILWFTFFAGSPVIITRVFPAKNDFAVFKAAVISVILIAVISFLLYFTAGLMRGVEPELAARDLVMFQAFLHRAPPVLGLVGVAGILTATVSTASVLFCLAGFSISRDLFGLLNPVKQEEANNVRRARIAQAFAVGIGGIAALLYPSSGYDLSLFACGTFAASWLPTILMSLLWKRYNSTAAFYGMFSGVMVLIVLQVLLSTQAITLPDTLHYIISMGVSILVSVCVTLRKPTDPSNARRHYQIRSAQLSDHVVREARISPDTLPLLLKDYHQVRQTMLITAISTAVVLLGLCVVFYQLVWGG